MTYGMTDWQTDWLMDRETDRQTYGQRDGQTERWTDRQILSKSNPFPHWQQVDVSCSFCVWAWVHPYIKVIRWLSVCTKESSWPLDWYSSSLQYGFM